MNETAKNILFITGSAILTKSSYNSLKAIATDLKEDDNVELMIEGHTDNIGTAKSNQTLSETRANTVKNYLLQQGVAAQKITTIGFGATQPIATNDTPEGRAQNRRVILKLQ